MSVYSNPLYYEIAFSFVKPEEQLNLFLEYIAKYSDINVESFLDIGCGPSLQLREIAKRGYNATGLDNSPEMLEYLRIKSEEENIEINTIEADMIDFKLEKRVDFVFIMMGTISYIRSNRDFLKHLDCIANSLKKGGLYLIENFRLNWADENFFRKESWLMQRGKIKVKTSYSVILKDILSQILEEELILNVNDSGKNEVIKERNITKMIFPQELLTLIQLNNKFDFIGWFERNSTEKLKKANPDNIIILKRKS